VSAMLVIRERIAPNWLHQLSTTTLLRVLSRLTIMSPVRETHDHQTNNNRFRQQILITNKSNQLYT